MNEITLNLAGAKYQFRYNVGFTLLQIKDGRGWHRFSGLTLGCGHTLDYAQVVQTIKHKLASLN